MKHKYLIDDPELSIYIDYKDYYIEVFRPLYRFSGYTPISRDDYLTIINSIRNVIILGEDIEFKYFSYGAIGYFIKNFCCQLFIEPERVLLKSRNLDFMYQPNILESHKKEGILEKVDSILIKGL